MRDHSDHEIGCTEGTALWQSLATGRNSHRKALGINQASEDYEERNKFSLERDITNEELRRERSEGEADRVPWQAFLKRPPSATGVV